MELRDADKLVLIMLSHIYEKLAIEDDIDPKFLQDVIFRDQAWALRWKYPGIFAGAAEDPAAVSDVVHIMEMWSLIEDSIGRLTAEDRRRIEKDSVDHSRTLGFSGFDGIQEAEHMGIATTLVERLDKFPKYKGKNMNAHVPTLERARRMLRVYEPLRQKLGSRVAGSGELLTADEIISIVEAS